jgi:hypothetical protein
MNAVARPDMESFEMLGPKSNIFATFKVEYLRDIEVAILPGRLRNSPIKATPAVLL